MNTALLVIKFATGIFGNSFALIADGIESVVDVFASILVLFEIKYSTLPANDNHLYCHGKAEPLITFLAVGFLTISAEVGLTFGFLSHSQSQFIGSTRL